MQPGATFPIPPRLFPYQLQPFLTSQNFFMVKNYFRTAWRAVFQHKLYTTLNIAGLTFGISCFLLIGLYVFDELNFDRQHSKADRIYRVIEHQKTKGEELTIAAASYKLAEESKKAIAEIETTTRFSTTGRDNISNPANLNKFNETISYCDNTFFKVFDFDFIEGNRNTALNEPYAIVLTEELALRLFGSTHIVGKPVRIDFIETPLTVTGVIKDHKRNSSFNFSYVMSEITFKNQDFYKRMVASDWSSHSYSVYALLKENARAAVVAKKMSALVYANYKQEEGNSVDYRLQALPDMHLYSEGISDGTRSANAATGGGKLLYVKIFCVVAIFVLLIACINYMNLATARASNRAKEIGIRKSIGAFRGHLIIQFLSESMIITAISFLLSIGVVNLILPSFNEFTGKELSLFIWTDYRIWLYTIVVMILTGFLSGSYPALLLSKSKPVLLLKGIKFNHKNGLNLRKALVVFQFTISIIMIIATIVLVLQVRYVNSKDLGFNKEQLVVVDINSGTVRREAQTIKTEFSKIAGVKNVSITSRVPGEWKTIPTIKIKTAADSREHQVAYLIGADENFVKTFEADFINGRNFVNRNDSTNIILNETAARMLNIKEASDQLVDIPSRAFGGSYFPVSNDNKPFQARVIGIVKDFNFQSLREKIAPLVLAYQQNPVHNIDYFTARIDGREEASILKKMTAVIAGIDGNHLFEYHFLDDQLALFYTEDHRRETLLIWIAIATIFIACMGLFGLATYTAEQRVKEIGVRKVLGANVPQLISLLSKDFVKLVLVANIIAVPFAWLATSRWLREFAYHINISWWIFIVAGIAAIAVALATVSFQAIKAAVANPVKSLRTE